MFDILHRASFKASPDDAYKALAMLEGLSGWWTNNTQGESKVGGVLQFRFFEAEGFDMKVLDLDPAKHVLWQVVEGPKEWIGTSIRWNSNRKATIPWSSSNIKVGMSQGSLCTIAAPSGQRSDETESACRNRERFPLSKRCEDRRPVLSSALTALRGMTAKKNEKSDER